MNQTKRLSQTKKKKENCTQWTQSTFEIKTVQFKFVVQRINIKSAWICAALMKNKYQTDVSLFYIRRSDSCTVNKY